MHARFKPGLNTVGSFFFSETDKRVQLMGHERGHQLKYMKGSSLQQRQEKTNKECEHITESALKHPQPVRASSRFQMDPPPQAAWTMPVERTGQLACA